MNPRTKHLIRRAPGAVAALAVAVAAVAGARSGSGADAKRTGEQVFAQQCAACHGAKGEGTKKYGKALVGDQSIGQLGTYIAKSMPPGAKHASPADAKLVAAYVYEAFYSPLAQARNKPARVELQRLTVRQYRNTLADLIASFRPQMKWGDQRGLHADYFRSRRLQRGERVLERVDPQVHFEFGQGVPGPEPDKFEPHTFSARWDGSVIAPDTGDYEFVVRTEHGTQLWVNDLRKPLIDAAVKSGNDTVYRGSIYLIGGFAYPLRLQFTKSTQGVDDTDKLKGRPIPSASISLEWKQPKGADEVIPQRALLPTTLPEVYAVSAAFPPDDRSIGYERGTSVSKEWDDATTEGAIETAAYVMGHLRELSNAPEEGNDREPRLREFCRQFVSRAFRRPLSPELLQTYVERQFQSVSAAKGDLEMAVKRVLLLTLKSPRFLFREANGPQPDGYDVASRLSYGLWDSGPDQELLRAAGAGELAAREQVARQAERMAGDPRTRAKLREFFLQWLRIDQRPELAKDVKRFPGFDASVAADLRTSLDLFIDSVVWSEKSDFRELLLSDKVFLNGRLAKLYGISLPPDAPFQEVALDPAERAGVITQPYLLAAFAYGDNSSPIHRGVLLWKNLFGRQLQPPPAAFAPLAAELHPNLTTRQRVTLQTEPAACAGCHAKFNPLGFTLEKFDAIGRFRPQENGAPIDASGAYESRSGQVVKFSGAHDLAKYMAESEEARGAFVEKLFQHLVKQPVRAYGEQAEAELERSFAANGYSVRKQLVEIMAASALKRAD